MIQPKDDFVARKGRRWFLSVAGGSVALAYFLQRGIGRAHLGPEAARERRPLRGRLRPLGELQHRHARRQVREPDVVPVLAGELLLGHAARRPAHGADPEPLVAGAG